MFESSLLGTRTARNRPEITQHPADTKSVGNTHTRHPSHTHSHAHNAPLLEAAGGSEMFCTAGSLGGMVSRHASIKPTSDGKKKKSEGSSTNQDGAHHSRLQRLETNPDTS